MHALSSSEPPSRLPCPCRRRASSSREAVDEGRSSAAAAERLAANLLDPLVREAVLEGAESKRRGKGDVVSVSKNVFIPLTNLCRDRCAYCTFAKQPDSPEPPRRTALEEVAEVVRGGVETGCREALFCLGDKPEVAYKLLPRVAGGQRAAQHHRLPGPGLPHRFRGRNAAHTPTPAS